ncbi:glutamate receptor ionotropic, kainate 2-like [Oratosquilla oratoria]|uniref:glutamate receptor ionotropic, kainate 2-like n=1 Tax=Oratosquilla oratoria TaxID=337810 RepID=UPI003F7598CC
MWRAQGSGAPTFFLREPIFPPLTELYRDMQGRILTSVYIPSAPFVIADDPPAEGEAPPDGVESLSGVDIELLKVLGSTMNFTSRMYAPEDDESWGNPYPNGTVSGMIGMAARHEAALIACDVTITVLTTLVMGIAANIVVRVKTGHRSRPAKPVDDVILNSFRSIVTQGNLLPLEDSLTRFLFSTWYLFSFVVGVLYSTTLMTYLLVPVYEKPIDNEEDLLEATRSRGYFFVLMKDTSTHSHIKVISQYGRDDYTDFKTSFTTTPIPTHRRQLYMHFPTDIQPYQAGLSQRGELLTEKVVSTGGKVNNHYKMIRGGFHRYHTSRESYANQEYGVVTPSGAPYLPRINEIITRLVEAGLVEQWIKDEYWKVQRREKSQKEDDEGLRAMGMDHLLSAFLLLLLGWGVSFLALSAELVNFRRSCARRVEVWPHDEAGIRQRSSVHPISLGNADHSANLQQTPREIRTPRQIRTRRLIRTPRQNQTPRLIQTLR